MWNSMEILEWRFSGIILLVAKRENFSMLPKQLQNLHDSPKQKR